MKQKLLAALTVIMLTVSALFAQVPQGIPYQGVARTNTGTIIANQNITLRLSIHDGTSNGTIVFQETHNLTTTDRKSTRLNSSHRT